MKLLLPVFAVAAVLMQAQGLAQQRLILMFADSTQPYELIGDRWVVPVESLLSHERKIHCGGYFMDFDSPHWCCNSRPAHLSVFLNKKYHVITSFSFEELLKENWPIRLTYLRWAQDRVMIREARNTFQ